LIFTINQVTLLNLGFMIGAEIQHFVNLQQLNTAHILPFDLWLQKIRFFQKYRDNPKNKD